MILTSCKDYDKINLYPVSNEDGKYGFIDLSGKLIIEFKFEYAHKFYDNLALVLFEGKAYYINKKGQQLFEASIKPEICINTFDIYESSEEYTNKIKCFSEIPEYYFFSEDFAAFYDTIIHAYGFINTKGEVVVKPKFFKVNSFHEGLAAVKINDTSIVGINIDFPFYRLEEKKDREIKYGYVNSKGNFVIEPIFKYASDFSHGKAFVNIQATNTTLEDSISVSLDLDGYVINKEGFTISPKINNTRASTYSSDGFIPAFNYVMNMVFGKGYFYLDSLYNHVPNNNGEESYFKDITTFSDGIAGVRIDDFWRVINTKWNIIIDEKYTDVKKSSEGLIPVKINKKWKYLNTKGKYPFNLEFDSCNNFYNGLAYVETYSSNSTIKGYINKKGEYMWQNILVNKKVKY